jgi:polyferredoxin
MTIEYKPKKEFFLQGNEQNKELMIRQKENQKWLYYLIIGSFGFITLLNFLMPDFHWVGPKPLNIKIGFMGLILTFFGSIFFFSAFFAEGGSGWFDLSWWLRVILCIVLLYFGLPMLFG